MHEAVGLLGQLGGAVAHLAETDVVADAAAAAESLLEEGAGDQAFVGEGAQGVAGLPRMLGLSIAFALGVAAVGLLVATTAMQNPASLGLLALPSVLLIAAYRAYSSFLLGHLLLEVSIHGADVGPLDVLDDETPDPGLHQYPTVHRLRRSLAEDHSAAEFEEALEALLDRMTLMRNRRTST